MILLKATTQEFFKYMEKHHSASNSATASTFKLEHTKSTLEKEFTISVTPNNELRLITDLSETFETFRFEINVMFAMMDMHGIITVPGGVKNENR